MRSTLTSMLVAVLAVGGVAACSDSSSPSSVTETQLAADLAASSGEGIVLDLAEYAANEARAGFAGALTRSAGQDNAAAAATDTSGVTASRSVACYDADGNPQSQCDPLTTASAHVVMQFDGIRQGDNFSIKIHRTRDMTISGLEGQETQRTHNGVGTSNDTTSFTRTAGTRTAYESAVDSIIDLVFQLPHASNPWPVSGQLIRNVNATITFTGAQEQTRTISRRVVVTFPADNQGNVAIQVGSLSCTLNLVTRRVINCTGT